MFLLRSGKVPLRTKDGGKSWHELAAAALLLVLDLKHLRHVRRAQLHAVAAIQFNRCCKQSVLAAAAAVGGVVFAVSMGSAAATQAQAWVELLWVRDAGCPLLAATQLNHHNVIWVRVWSERARVLCLCVVHVCRRWCAKDCAHDVVHDVEG